MAPHPFETWPATGRRAWVCALLAFFLVIGGALLAIGQQLAEGGLVGLELATSHARVEEILSAWAADGALGLGAFGLGLDMAYLVAYGLLLSVASANVAVRARDRGRTGLATASALAAWLALVAAAFDLIENAFQVPMFDDPTAGVPMAAASFATGKFALLAYVLVVAGVGRWLTRAPA